MAHKLQSVALREKQTVEGSREAMETWLPRSPWQSWVLQPVGSSLCENVALCSASRRVGRRRGGWGLDEARDPDVGLAEEAVSQSVCWGLIPSGPAGKGAGVMWASPPSFYEGKAEGQGEQEPASQEDSSVK